MKLIKIIFVNIFVISSLIGILLLTPPFVYTIGKNIKDIAPDSRAKLKLYSKYEWASTHFVEFNGLLTTYYDYFVWRRDNFKGNTINIIDGLRKTMNNIESSSSESQTWFFGGSTTWGTGVNDDYTYPSIFAKKTNDFVINFGESAYIARQSLAYLQNYLIKNNIKDMSGIKVIFYDGINDVMHRCRVDNTGIASVRQQQIQKNITNHFRTLGFRRTFGQVENFIQSIIAKYKKFTGEFYNCDSNQSRTKEIANSLIETWGIVSEIVESRGGKFVAILQPVSYIGNANINYLNSDLNSSLSLQFKTVYPLIKEAAASRNINFIDLTDIYNDCNNCYIDYFHVGPQGHQILVSKLITFLSNLD